MKLTPGWKRALKISVVSTVVLVAFVGVLHTSIGRPILAFFGVGCPFDKVTPEAMEQARLEAAHKTRGKDAAPERFALGFELDRSTREEVLAWAESHGIECEEKRAGAFLKCLNVPAAAVGAPATAPVAELCFQFSPSTKLLVNMTTLRTGLTGPDAEGNLKAVASTMEQRLGKPHKQVGEARGMWLTGGYLRTAALTYRFHDYEAEASATNTGERGVLLRERYMSIAD